MFCFSFISAACTCETEYGNKLKSGRGLWSNTYASTNDVICHNDEVQIVLSSAAFCTDVDASIELMRAESFSNESSQVNLSENSNGLETWKVEMETETETRPWIGLETVSRSRRLGLGLGLGPIPAYLSLLMRLSASALLLINWELSRNADSVCHKLIKVSLSLYYIA